MNVKAEYEYSSCSPEFVQDMYDELVEGFYKSAVRIRDRAKDLVPVGDLAAHPDKANPEMHLRDTIRAAKSRRKSQVSQLLQYFTERGSFYKDDPAAFVIAGKREADVYWQYWVEYGTYFKPARPFMRPAVDSNFNAILAEAERSGRRAVNKRRRLRKWGAGHA